MNRHGYSLIPFVLPLRHQLMEGLAADEDKLRTAWFELEVLPYSLAAAQAAFRSFVDLQRAIAGRAVSEGLSPETILVLGPGDRDAMSFAVDNFLDAARRTQNAIVPYLSKALRISLPMSLADVIKRIDANSITVPDPIKRELVEYWSRSGLRLKSYRDLYQHYALLVSEARVFLADDGSPLVYLLLPSNPEVRTPARLVFGSPPVHALTYLRSEFYSLLVFVDWLIKALLRAGPGTLEVGVYFRDPLTLGEGARHTGTRLLDPGQLDEELDTILGRLRGEA